jgi:hypothetical protein
MLWMNEGEVQSSIHEGDEPTGWDSETDKQFLTWATAVMERVDHDAHTVTSAAAFAAEATIIQRATA